MIYNITKPAILLITNIAENKMAEAFISGSTGQVKQYKVIAQQILSGRHEGIISSELEEALARNANHIWEQLSEAERKEATDFIIEWKANHP